MSDAPRLHPATRRPVAEIDDPSIPVLTDRIYLPALELDIAVPQTQPIAAPALQTSAYAEAAARPPEVSPIEIIGTVDLPAVALADLESVELTEEAAPVDEPVEIAGDEELASEPAGPPQPEAPIETELDRDLIAELDADFEALLSAEADLDAVDTAAPVASNGPAADAAAPETIAPDARRFSDDAATAAKAAGPPLDDSTLAAAAAPAEDGDGSPAEQPAPVADEAAMSGDTGDRRKPTRESTSTVREQAESVPAARDPQAIADEADSLRSAVIDAVAQRLPGHIDTTVRDLMRPAIDEAVTRLGKEAQLALRISLQQLVEQVLREELERRQSGRDPSAH